MYPTYFRFDDDPVTAFFKLIKYRTKTLLNPDDVLLSDPVAKTRTQTLIQIAPIKEHSLTGKVTVSYHRLDISQLFFGIRLILESDQPVDTLLIHHYLLSRWKVFVDPNDMVIERLYYAPPFLGRIKISIVPTSKVWVGEIYCDLLIENAINTLFEDYAIDYGNTMVQLNAWLYSVDRQLHIENEEILNYLYPERILYTLDYETHEIVEAFITATSDPWVIENKPLPFNLNEAKVAHHERVDENYIVLLIALSEHYCTNLKGYLHWTIYSPLPEEEEDGDNDLDDPSSDDPIDDPDDNLDDPDPIEEGDTTDPDSDQNGDDDEILP